MTICNELLTWRKLQRPTLTPCKRSLLSPSRIGSNWSLYISFAFLSPVASCASSCLAGGLDEALYNVIAMAREQEIPFVFALGRKALGRCVNKLVPVSVVGIFNYSGAEASSLCCDSLRVTIRST